MKGYDIKKSPSVSKLIDVKITGNVIPLEWFNHIKRENGKPHTVAIMLLSDIVYWYRPIENRDEETGKLLGYRKKFAADKLQRSYKAFADLYGYTKNQVREALSYLENMKLINLKYCHPIINGQKFGNILYIGLNVDNLLPITHPLSNLNRTGYQEIIEDPPRFKPDTNTETTTEITTELKDTTWKQFLELWADLFPDKSQPRKDNKKLKVKISVRMQEQLFLDNWQEALMRASESATCQKKSWFHAEFFLRNSDNYMKCYERWQEWQDEKITGVVKGERKGRNYTTERNAELERIDREKQLQGQST